MILLPVSLCVQSTVLTPQCQARQYPLQERMELAALLMFSLDQWLPFLCY